MDGKIILASASPRRKELLKNMGLDFDVMPSSIEENIDNKPFSYTIAESLALEKALYVSKQIHEPAVIIGSDTVVVIDNIILGKPEDKNDAYRMLKLLSGRTHKVISAIAVYDNQTKKTVQDSVTSYVEFRELTDEEIWSYVNSGEPVDKAGAYAIQGKAAIFVKRINGCYSNIVGISVYKLSEILKEFEIKVL